MGFSLGKAVSSIFGGGDSGSSSSTSTATNYNDTSKKTENVTDFGLLSHDNLSIGADTNFTYTEQGITGSNLDSLLNATTNLNDTTQSTLSNTFNRMVGSVQNSAETAINSTAALYTAKDNELRSVIDGVRPIALYAALAAMAYFIFRR